ncbi:MAG TPA: YcxB family protein [Actinomycetota bacterium]|nr:YcxB family protein [Actinomycetota bacterium]
MPEDFLRHAHRRMRVAYALFFLWAALSVVDGFLHGGDWFVVAACVALVLGSIEVRLQRSSRRHPQLGQVWMELSDDGVTAVTPQLSSRQAWQYFKSYRETPSAFLLRTRVSCQILPKHFFRDPVQVAAARTLLAQHLSAR